MHVKEMTKSLVPGFARPLLSNMAGRLGLSRDMNFAFDPSGDVRKDIVDKYGESDLVDLFVDNKGALVDKWHHYLGIYERYFGAFRGKPVRMLEIGVSAGGSLQMWRRYFGEQAIIYGIDIEEACRIHDGKAAQVRIGSQADPAFLKAVVEEMGGLDLVLDDGSHHMNHIPVSLETLFPLMAEGGVYMIEDLHTAYWWNHGGGYAATRNFHNYVASIVRDMHRWYHGRGMQRPGVSDLCSGIHVHDSIVVLDRSRTYPPVYSRIS